MYRPSSGDVNRTLRVLVIARGPAGAAAALSTPTARIAKASSPAPQNRSLPGVQGLARQGERLSADRGRWANSPSAYAYTWLRCDRSGNGCAAIPGAHGSAYIATPADIGHTIRLQVDARNAGGLTRAFSPPTAIVAARPSPAAAKPANTVRPSIAGTAQEGKALTGNRGAWTNNPTGFDYSWHRCDRNGGDCDTIGSARGTTSYTLRSDDIGKTIRFRVRARNSSGSDKASSGPTAVVRAAARPENTSPPTISGTPAEGGDARRRERELDARADLVRLRLVPLRPQRQQLRRDRRRPLELLPADLRRRRRHAPPAGHGRQLRGQQQLHLRAHDGDPARAHACPVARPRLPGRRQPRPGDEDLAARPAPDRQLQAAPRVVTRGTAALIVRFHVTSTCGGPVQGALVYATATPYNQFAIPPEAPTGADGWATLVFRRLQGFPVSGRQQLIAVFVRARKPGESVLGGISTRRLVSIPVRLG